MELHAMVQSLTYFRKARDMYSVIANLIDIVL
jgi:hypothetical protein